MWRHAIASSSWWCHVYFRFLTFGSNTIEDNCHRFMQNIKYRCDQEHNNIMKENPLMVRAAGTRVYSIAHQGVHHMYCWLLTSRSTLMWAWHAWCHAPTRNLYTYKRCISDLYTSNRAIWLVRMLQPWYNYFFFTYSLYFLFSIVKTFSDSQ